MTEAFVLFVFSHVGDHEAAPSGLVLRLPCHDGAVDVVGVGSGREDEEERSQAEEDVEQGRNRALHALRGGGEQQWRGTAVGYMSTGRDDARETDRQAEIVRTCSTASRSGMGRMSRKPSWKRNWLEMASSTSSSTVSTKFGSNVM